MSRQRWSALISWTSFALLLMSVGLNTLQARRIRDLIEPQSKSSSRVGQMAGPLAGLTLEGQKRVVRFDDRQPTVLYFFSPTCRWCEENWDNVRTLAEASSARFRFLAVATESNLTEYVHRHRLNFDILVGVVPENLTMFGLGATPHTLVISSQGQISHEWRGAYQGRSQRAIESFFDIRLPGLVRPKGR